MAQVEAKVINGHKYYYACEWRRVDGKPRRVWQKYLGKAEDILRAVEGSGRKPLFAQVFQWGIITALWLEARRAEVIAIIDNICMKRSQGLTIGQYILIAALNRAIQASSKNSMWQWFRETALVRYVPQASADSLCSQRFWDHMRRFGHEECLQIWTTILKGVITRENIDPASISYDGTNYYTFIDTFNERCSIAKRGKNKQGQDNLRQVSYSLFCAADGQIPLYYDVYEGNRNDAKEFLDVIGRFDKFLKITFGVSRKPEVTIIFDKGNNSKDNFKLLKLAKLHFVGSVKLGEHTELAAISNSSGVLRPCQDKDLLGNKALRKKKRVSGILLTTITTYNPELFDTQRKTLQNDITHAIDGLQELQKKLNDRRNGLVTKGKKPTKTSIENQCKDKLHRQFLSRVIVTEVTLDDTTGVPFLQYHIDREALAKLEDTYLGKTIIVTTRHEWDTDRIIKAYRSQYLVEGIFKKTKDRATGTWWPLYHWIDAHIKVHALYCSIALLLRQTLQRRVAAAGINISYKRLETELGRINEVVNTYELAKHKGTKDKTETTLTRMSGIQQKLVNILRLQDKAQLF